MERVWRQLHEGYRTVIWVSLACLLIYYVLLVIPPQSYQYMVSGTWRCDLLSIGYVKNERLDNDTVQVTIGGTNHDCSVQRITLTRDGEIHVHYPDGSKQSDKYSLHPYTGVESWECRGFLESHCQREAVLHTKLNIPDLTVARSASGENAYVLELRDWRQLHFGAYQGYNGRSRMYMNRVPVRWNSFIDRVHTALGNIRNGFSALNYTIRPLESRLSGTWVHLVGAIETADIRQVTLNDTSFQVNYSNGIVQHGDYLLGENKYPTQCNCGYSLMTTTPIIGIDHNMTPDGKYVYHIEHYSRSVIGIYSYAPPEERRGLSMKRSSWWHRISF